MNSASPSNENETIKGSEREVSEQQKDILDYELFGESNETPFLFLHGGPGAGFAESDKELFDRKHHKVIFYNQRGVGSKNWKILPDQHLKDITHLLKHLGFEKIRLIGGSWGSLLSLMYAIQNPEKVEHIIIWGVFSGTTEECDYYIRGGSKLKCPDIWARFVKDVPKDQRLDPAPYYFQKMTEGSKEEASKFSYEWAYFETAMSRLHYSDAQVRGDLEGVDLTSLAIQECYYNLNNFFIDDRYIWKNLSKLEGIPISLHQGRHDCVCPPETAFKISQQLKNSRLDLVTAGHSHLDKELRSSIEGALNV